MSVEYKFQTSFAAGEWAPSLYARVDLEKYASGAALLRNFFADYRGGATTRPGTQFLNFAAEGYTGQPRLIPFVVSTDAAYVCEFGNGYIRFWTNGGLVVDSGNVPIIISSPYTTSALPMLKYSQSANVLTLTHPSYPIYDLRRTAVDAFALTQRVIAPKIDFPSNLTGAQINTDAPNAKQQYYYVVTAVNEDGEESLQSDIFAIGGSILNQNTATYNTLQWGFVAGATSYNVYKAGPGSNTDGPPSVDFGYIGQSQSPSFIDNNIAQDLSKTPPLFADPFTPGQVASVRVDSAGTGYSGAIRALIFIGDGSGAAGYCIIDQTSDSVVGAVVTRPGSGYTTVAVTDADANTALYTAIIGQQSGTYPATSTYYQQRQVFGGTANFPEALVMSQPGAYSNFDIHSISLDTDSITVSLASRQLNYIKSMVSMNTGLIVLTSGGAFLVSGGGPDAPVTPATISALPQASSGANDLPPLVVNYDILYMQNRGAVVRDLAFNFYVQSYTGTDRSVLASHLFSGYAITEWTYAEEPFRLVHAIRNDGVMLAFTYVPEQEIFAWTHYDTAGLFCSVASIPEGDANAVYLIVQRFLGGIWRYCVERFANRVIHSLEDAWCVDCGLALPNVNPQATIYLSAATGTGVVVQSDPPIFDVGQIGSTLWAGEGQATVAGFIDSSHIVVDVVQDFPTVGETSIPHPYPPGDWELNPNVTTVSGLDYLEGQSVVALADGAPVPARTVVAGSIQLPQPASKVTVGLPFTCQLQTLRIDFGEPTQQGKRKIVKALTVRLNATSGGYVGADFATMTPLRDAISAYPFNFTNGDAREIILSQWNKEGQFCFSQLDPLPATVLGVIPEVVIGDTVSGLRA